MIGSRRVLKWAMLHDGDTLRSEDEFADTIRRGTSAAVVWNDMFSAEVAVHFLQRLSSSEGFQYWIYKYYYHVPS